MQSRTDPSGSVCRSRSAKRNPLETCPSTALNVPTDVHGAFGSCLRANTLRASPGGQPSPGFFMTKPKSPTAAAPTKATKAKPAPGRKGAAGAKEPAAKKRPGTAALPPATAFRRADTPAAQEVPAVQLAPAAPPAPKPLTDRDLRFCREYVLDQNGTRAYMRATACLNEKTAATESWRLLRKPEIQAQVAAERDDLQKRTGATTEELVRELLSIVRADPRDLVEYLVGACRYCHGIDHRYHRTQAEYDRELADFEESGRLPRRLRNNKDDDQVQDWDVEGGPGYDQNREPHEDCPECGGRGAGRTVVKDTRLLSVDAARLYAGVKETKEGIEVKMHSRSDAIEKLAKFLGMYEADNRQRKADDPLTALLLAISGPKAALPIVANPAEGSGA